MTKKKSKTEEAKKVYNKLKKQGLSNEDIAENFVFPSEPLTKKELKELGKKLQELRDKRWERMTPEEQEEEKLLIEKIRNK